MFTKLKNKIAEEVKQSPLKLSASVQQLAQAVVSPSSSSIVEPASNDHFSIGDDSEETPQNSPSKSGGFQSVDLHGEAPVSPPLPPGGGGRSRRSSTSSVTSDASSLFPIFESSVLNSFSLQSDLESASEVEDSLGHQLDKISKEQLYTAYRKMQARYSKYKGRYADLVRHYRELDRENVKAKTVLVESQDKALRRIAELKEQCQLEQKAKAHLEDVLRNDLEEKDHLISTLYTKIELMKLNGGKEESEASNQVKNSSENLLIDLSVDPAEATPTKQPKEDTSPLETDAVLREKVRKLETLLSKCKESIKRNKERISQLTTENQELQQTLEVTKESSSTQVTTLSEELTTARNEIVKLVEALDTLRKREEDAALSLAENKLTIHRELEAKEEQIKSLRNSLTQLTQDKEALIERASSLQNEVTELKSVAAAPASEDVSSSEEDRQSLIQELSRGKAEAVKLLQQEMQRKLIDLEKKMSEKLLSSEQTKKQLEIEIETIKRNVEEKEQTNRELEQKLKSFEEVKCASTQDETDSKQNLQSETAVKELEDKLTEKENAIKSLEENSKLLIEEHNKELKTFESRIDAESAERVQIESKLSERDHELKELHNLHKQQLEEKHKLFSEVQAQLSTELAMKSEVEKKYKDLLNQMGNLENSLKNKDAEVSKLSFEIVSLKERAQNLEEKLMESTEECAKIKAEKESLHSIVTFSLKAVFQLKKSLQALRNDVHERLNSARSDGNEIAVQVLNAFDQAKKEVISVRKELVEKDHIQNSLKENIAILEKELSQQKEYVEQEGNLESMVDDLRSTKRNLEIELSENKALVKKLQHELQNTTKTLEVEEHEVSKLNSSIVHLQADLAMKMQKTNEDLLNLKSEHKVSLKAKDAEISELKSKYDDSCSKVKSLQSDVSSAENKLEEINKDYNKLKEENEKLATKVSELEGKCESLKREFSTVTEERTKLGGTVEELTNVLTGHKKENDALNEKIKHMADTLSNSNNETLGLKEQVEELSNSLNKATTENQALKSEIEEFKVVKLKLENNLKSQEQEWNDKSKADKVKMKKLESAVHSLQKELKNEKQRLEADISKLLSQFEQSQQRERELETETKVLKEESMKAKGDESNFESCISGLRMELGQAEQREQQLLAQIEELSERRVELEQQLNEKQAQLENLAAERQTLMAKCESESSRLEGLEAELSALNIEKEKWKEEQTSLKVRHEELNQFNNSITDQLNQEVLQRKLLDDEFKNIRESKDILTKKVEELNCVIEHLKKTTAENVEVNEQLRIEKTELQQSVEDNAVKEKEHVSKVEFLQTEVERLKSENSILISEKDGITQQLETVKKELQDTITDRNSLEDTRQDVQKIVGEKGHLEEKVESLQKEMKDLEEQLNNERSDNKNREEEEKKKLEEARVYNKELQSEIENSLKEKMNLDQTLTTTLGNLEALQMEMIAERERHRLDVEELRKQLEDTLLEKRNLQRSLSAEFEKAREVTASELMKLQSDKEQLEQQLDNTLMDLQAKEKQVSELEDLHTQKIKQLVRDFEKQLAQKEEDLANLEDKKYETSEKEQNIQVREYRDHIKDLHEASEAQGEAFQQLYLQHEEAIKVKESELNNSEHRIKELQTAHQRELAEVDKRWRQCLEQQLAEAESRHKEELTELSKEWHWERKELESTSQLAVAAVESGTGSIELLHRQLVAQTNELKEAKRLHRLEVAELRRLLSLRKTSNSSDNRISGFTTLEDACTELEYLRNILYEYMMGREPVVLARVIAAVVKFDSEQTTNVLQKEEQKQTLLGQLGIL
ncbi:golgin subfamily A member 4-like isoform X2 [Periplaneta americana]|uniref:golgin subfamily A member 4-like isoform X2 n=1 Tax=Periplaneta americana TaxID=6978 RepID=UPI0037E82C8F